MLTVPMDHGGFVTAMASEVNDSGVIHFGRKKPH